MWNSIRLNLTREGSDTGPGGRGSGKKIRRKKKQEMGDSKTQFKNSIQKCKKKTRHTFSLQIAQGLALFQHPIQWPVYPLFFMRKLGHQLPSSEKNILKKILLRISHHWLPEFFPVGRSSTLKLVPSPLGRSLSPKISRRTSQPPKPVHGGLYSLVHISWRAGKGKKRGFSEDLVPV